MKTLPMKYKLFEKLAAQRGVEFEKHPQNTMLHGLDISWIAVFFFNPLSASVALIIQDMD